MEAQLVSRVPLPKALLIRFSRQAEGHRNRCSRQHPRKAPEQLALALYRSKSQSGCWNLCIDRLHVANVGISPGKAARRPFRKIHHKAVSRGRLWDAVRQAGQSLSSL